MLRKTLMAIVLGSAFVMPVYAQQTVKPSKPAEPAKPAKPAAPTPPPGGNIENRQPPAAPVKPAAPTPPANPGR